MIELLEWGRSGCSQEGQHWPVGIRQQLLQVSACTWTKEERYRPTMTGLQVPRVQSLQIDKNLKRLERSKGGGKTNSLSLLVSSRIGDTSLSFKDNGVPLANYPMKAGTPHATCGRRRASETDSHS